MPTYMIQGRYSAGAIANLIAKPEDRSKAAATGIKAAGGKLLQYFMSFGDYDFMAIAEFPSDEAAMASAMASGSVGHVMGLKTTKLMTGGEARKAMAAAAGVVRSYPAPRGS